MDLSLQWSLLRQLERPKCGSQADDSMRCSVSQVVVMCEVDIVSWSFCHAHYLIMLGKGDVYMFRHSRARLQIYQVIRIICDSQCRVLNVLGIG
jgi:hypothetical protein